MNEIEKLYKNAGIKKKYCGWLDMGDLDCQMQYVTCNSVNEWMEAVFSSRFGKTEENPELKYPEFTAEKQIELIKCLLTKIIDIEHIHLEFSDRTFKFFIHSVVNSSDDCDTLENALCSYINNLWQDLTEEERKLIKDILE